MQCFPWSEMHTRNVPRGTPNISKPEVINEKIRARGIARLQQNAALTHGDELEFSMGKLIFVVLLRFPELFCVERHLEHSTFLQCARCSTWNTAMVIQRSAFAQEKMMFHVERSVGPRNSHCSPRRILYQDLICTEYFVLHIVVRCIQR